MKRKRREVQAKIKQKGMETTLSMELWIFVLYYDLYYGFYEIMYEFPCLVG